MKLIVGFGNPGEKYKNSRHNIGFIVVDAYAREKNLGWRYSQDLMSYYIRSDDFMLVKPTTYMNKSGEAVRQVSEFYKVETADIVVIHDDLDLDFGKIRLSFDSTSAGHRGVDSLIESLGGFEFGRLRVGIGRPKEGSGSAQEKAAIVEKYVLSEFSDSQKSQLPSVLKRCMEATESYLDEGIEATMNRFN
ncbi:aminoacyl-tRNA hydrolase [Candidatus Curtissbacteria bacterium]|nr:aminoacyl-tRNA hydrolase [Candidatus Curtissbacteria bacterium]MBI2594536.1 aminoacyl-tRNA hydrolase [Candidatus Curtissbacteria bacterium]